MIGANVLYLGPDKAGSTWLYWQARQHPEMYVPESKEIFFWDKYYEKGIEWYKEFYRGAEVYGVRMDISHDYLYSSAAAERVRGWACYLKKALVFAREPVARAYSSYRFMISQGRIASDIRFADAVQDVSELLGKGRYSSYVENWRAALGASKVWIGLYECLRADEAKFWKELCEQLGVDCTPPVPLPPEKKMVARRARWPWLVNAGRRVGWKLRDFGLHGLVWRLKNAPVLERALWSWGDGSSPGADEIESVRRRHRGWIRSEAEYLSELTGKDVFELWGV